MFLHYLVDFLGTSLLFMATHPPYLDFIFIPLQHRIGPFDAYLISIKNAPLNQHSSFILNLSYFVLQIFFQPFLVNLHNLFSYTP